MSGLPPLASHAVFAPSASIIIDAPRDTVWQVLMDWASYHEWNPFVASLTHPRDPFPRLNKHLVPGLICSYILSAFVVITAMDPDNYRCAWDTVGFPSWLLSGTRWQTLVEVEEEGRKKTRYESIEVFSGLLAYAIWFFVGSGLQQGYVAMAEGLKKRSEELQRGE